MKTAVFEIDDRSAAALEAMAKMEGVSPASLLRSLTEWCIGETACGIADEGTGENSCFRPHVSAAKYYDEGGEETYWDGNESVDKMARLKPETRSGLFFSDKFESGMAEVRRIFEYKDSAAELIEEYLDVTALATDTHELLAEVWLRVWDNEAEAKRVASRVSKKVGRKMVVVPSSEEGKWDIVPKAKGRTGGNK